MFLTCTALLLGGLVASPLPATAADESGQTAAIMQERAKFEAAYLKGWELQNPIQVSEWKQHRHGDTCAQPRRTPTSPPLAVFARRRCVHGIRKAACVTGCTLLVPTPPNRANPHTAP